VPCSAGMRALTLLRTRASTCAAGVAPMLHWLHNHRMTGRCSCGQWIQGEPGHHVKHALRDVHAADALDA
jgi:hypothetical protein